MIHPAHIPTAPNAAVSGYMRRQAREYLRRAAICERCREKVEAARLRLEAVKALRLAAFYTHGKGIPA